jgi:hypothetical protein
MACDRPDGNCTNVSPCGAGCGCTGEPPEPIVPRCQDIVLTPGTFASATVVVNASGCISSVTAGTPAVYTPDECCDGGAGGGTGLPGARGPQGDPGAAATIAVDPNIPVGATTAWTVENVGTPSAAIFQFTAPAPVVTPPGPTGVTGSVAGLAVTSGVVTALPPSLVLAVAAAKSGAYANYFTFVAAPVSPALPNNYTFTLDLDAFATQVIAAAGASGLDARLTAVEDALTGVPSSVFEVAAATGVNLIDPGGAVAPTARVTASPNVWHIGVGYVGLTITDSNGGTATVSALGRVTLPALTYPVSLV